MIILSIDTSCDETAVAVTKDTTILTNTIWSQAALHADFGGVVPSLAQRAHRERIDWVIEKALKSAQLEMKNIDAIAVTAGPGLAIALEVGISKAKELSKKYKKPLITVNHIEGHLLSSLARSKKIKSQKLKIKSSKFPALGVATSGKHTDIVYIKAIGDYEILAYTLDDAIGEALDKGARLLGFGYPGGHMLEQVAKKGDATKEPFPIPMIGREKEHRFSYSGLKTALFLQLDRRKNQKHVTQSAVANLAAGYQQAAFTHFLRVLENILEDEKYKDIKTMLAGGGVMANVSLRKMLRDLCTKHGLQVHYPYSKRLYGDNAGMIGVAAYFKFERGEVVPSEKIDSIDRIPRAKVDISFPWEKPFKKS